MSFIAITKHNDNSDESLKVRESYDECVEIIHDFFLSYDFEIKDGRPFDEGNDDGAEEGFEVFSNVVIHNEKIAGFTHCHGDGPSGEIRESN